ncbi:hypothetical protein A2U01_0068753, partial [Trifolium medium]|nr:hypothetical protein [Trifolium medium]
MRRSRSPWLFRPYSRSRNRYQHRYKSRMSDDQLCDGQGRFQQYVDFDRNMHFENQRYSTHVQRHDRTSYGRMIKRKDHEAPRQNDG